MSGTTTPVTAGHSPSFPNEYSMSSLLELTLVSSVLELVKLRYNGAMRWSELKDQQCPVARGLSVIGDRWTMLVLRDCFQDVRRFDDFQKRLGITRHVLADRLRKLEEAGASVELK